MKITEDYVSFETAKLLKEKGFDEFTFSDYNENGIVQFNEVETRVAKGYQRPTLQMACKWLREEKHFYIQIMLDSWALGRHSGYYIVIQDTNSDFEEICPIVNEEDTIFFSTYEEAVEAALNYTLKNLI